MDTAYKRIDDFIRDLSDKDTITISVEDIRQAMIEIREEAMVKSHQAGREEWLKQAAEVVGLIPNCGHHTCGVGDAAINAILALNKREE